MKTFLVPVGGSDTDEVVFETALAVARPLAAYLEFLHIHVGAGEAALHVVQLFATRRTIWRSKAKAGRRRRRITFASSAHARSPTWSTSLACRKSPLPDGGKKREMHSNA